MNADRFSYIIQELEVGDCTHLLRIHGGDPRGLAELARLAGWWSTYLIQSEGDGSLYTGIALDVEGRLKRHNKGRGAKRTRGRGPWKLVWAKVFGQRSWAARIEARLKKLSRKQKLALIAGTLNLDDLAATMGRERSRRGRPEGL